MEIRMSAPDLTEAELAAVLKVLGTPFLSMGPQIKRFEERFASRIGRRYAAAVSSGTAGLRLCVIAAGIGEGDLVIAAPFSFVASGNCALYERGVPVFVDADEQTGNIDPALVAQAAADLVNGGAAARRWLPPSLRDGRQGWRLKAILPVHVFGQPADMDPLLEVAHTYELYVIEDACEAVGAGYKGRNVGTVGDAAVFAFYPNKQMTTGEGGIIVTDHDDWDVLFRSLRNQGRDPRDGWLTHARLGYNYRMNEMSAALGLAQLERLDQLLAKRAQVAQWYTERLAEIEGVEPLPIAPWTTRMSWFAYVVRIKHPFERDEVMRQLEKRCIPSRPYFRPIHLQPFYRERFGYRGGEFPVAETLSSVSLALPFSSVMEEREVQRVCEALKEILR